MFFRENDLFIYKVPVENRAAKDSLHVYWSCCSYCCCYSTYLALHPDVDMLCNRYLMYHVPPTGWSVPSSFKKDRKEQGLTDRSIDRADVS